MSRERKFMAVVRGTDSRSGSAGRRRDGPTSSAREGGARGPMAWPLCVRSSATEDRARLRMASRGGRGLGTASSWDEVRPMMNGKGA
eukprot:scaffold109935_cov32-Tisochrysis_lutea.AAC.3